ncbi:MAG: hypothetical protein K6T83_15065 [Alicyclobacillus sp.]|nr:hypothetical protein [Alicyclobacillus sp.]
MTTSTNGLGQVLEELQTAYHSVDKALSLIDEAGAFRLLEDQVEEIHSVLRELSEIACALLDAQLRNE